MPRIPLATVAVLALAAAPAGAIVVDSTADSVAVDGACTLREAIDNVNAGVDTTGGDCATGSTITFDPSTDGVPIVLTGADGDDLNLSGGLDHHRAARDQGWCNAAVNTLRDCRIVGNTSGDVGGGVGEGGSSNRQIYVERCEILGNTAAITNSDGVTMAAPGDVLTYTIAVTNPGPSDALAVAVEDAFPPELIGCEWTCAPAGGALCTAGPATGDLVDSADLAAGSSATYTAVCTVDPGASVGVLSNTATVTAPAGVTDPNPADNAATDVDFGTDLLFADGFESGDTTAWSEATP